MKKLLLIALAVLGAGCYRHNIILDRGPAEPRRIVQLREHALGHLVDDNTMNLRAWCDGRIARIYQRGLWYASSAIAADVYCRAP
jgi:hypothetical protein